MSKNQKILLFTAFMLSMAYFSSKTIGGIMELNEYSGWNFYALLGGTIIFGGMTLVGLFFLPRIKKAYLDD